MKIILTLLILLANLTSYSQKSLFRVYIDSASLVQDAKLIVTDFTNQVDALRLVFSSKPTAILNTKPFLIFYSSKLNQVNLPIWEQVIPEQKNFFATMAGSEKEGEKIFGLFFNGFYLAHEMGHALQKAANKRATDLYQNEYFANTIAILYWKKKKRNKELKQCYNYAKKMVDKLANPVPVGEDPVKYFNDHYNELGSDPYKYGYYQFAQFVKIYEDKTIPGFDEFVRKFLSQ